MVLQCHVANKNHPISITRVSMTTKLGRMITSLDWLLPIMSHDPLITWPCEIRGSLTGGGSAWKCLSRHRLLVSFCAQLTAIKDMCLPAFTGSKTKIETPKQCVQYVQSY